MGRREAGVLGMVFGSGEEVYRTSHSRPSVAVCFLVFNSFTTSDCSVSDSLGAANWRSRTFLYQSAPPAILPKYPLPCPSMYLDIAHHVVLDGSECH